MKIWEQIKIKLPLWGFINEKFEFEWALIENDNIVCQHNVIKGLNKANMDRLVISSKIKKNWQ